MQVTWIHTSNNNSSNTWNHEIYKPLKRIRWNKINCCFGCVLFIHVACLWMCVLLYFSFVCPHVCAFAFKSKVYCGSALGPGASGLPYYCTPLVCVPAVIGVLAVWRQNTQKRISNSLVPANIIILANPPTTLPKKFHDAWPLRATLHHILTYIAALETHLYNMSRNLQPN